MNKRTASISIMAIASILAVTITISSLATSAFAVGNPTSNRQSAGQSAQANDNGLAGVAANVAVGVQAGNICVAALATQGC
jgi:hypothetical protein